MLVIRAKKKIEARIRHRECWWGMGQDRIWKFLIDLEGFIEVMFE